MLYLCKVKTRITKEFAWIIGFEANMFAGRQLKV